MAAKSEEVVVPAPLSEAVPSEFPFPFQPYAVQTELMRNVYHILDKGLVGIVESPTGTGKSLSLICSSLSWLRDYEGRAKLQLSNDLDKAVQQKKELEKEEGRKDVDWIDVQSRRIKAQEEVVRLQERIERMRKKEEVLKGLIELGQKSAKVSEKDIPSKAKVVVEEKEDEEWLLQEDVDDNGSDKEEEEEVVEEDPDESIKILYCSRTHSQLRQFVEEVRRSPFADQVRLVSLGSRQTLCINESVRGLKNVSMVNQRCLDLQKRRGVATSTGKRARKGSGPCQFLRNPNGIRVLSAQTMSRVMDVEELATEGRKVTACPYYAARRAVPNAQLVLAPYSSLLQASTRLTLGLARLDRYVLLIDEAHNLLETVAQLHSAEVSGRMVALAHEQLTLYLDRFRDRLNPKKMLKVKQLLFVVKAIAQYVANISNIRSSVTANGSAKTDSASSQSTMSGATQRKKDQCQRPLDFLSSVGIDHMNLLDLVAFCRTTRLAQKVRGYTLSCSNKGEVKVHRGVSAFLQKLKGEKKDVAEEASAKKEVTEIDADALARVTDFIDAIVRDPEEDGRVLTQANRLRYLVLNAAARLHSVMSQCKAVVMAGGTMQPSWELRQLLARSAGVASERFHELSCGHVVASSNVLAIALSSGTDGREIDLSWACRGSDWAARVAQAVANMVTIVPGGMVMFLPSYDCLDIFWRHLEGAGTSALARIHARKEVFREPRGSSDVESVLRKYAKQVNLGGGALLLSVVGGKLSEGINFGDDLGRCVILAGMPYPNSHAADVQEKMRFLDSLQQGWGRRHLQALCFRAVGQSVGRVLRHKNDYAAIVLLDHRFCRDDSIQALPKWVQPQLRKEGHFGRAIVQLRKFYDERKQVNTG